MVWTDDTPGQNDIFFSNNTDGGNNFSIPLNLSNNTGTSLSPQIALSGNNVYVVWTDDTPGQNDIFFSNNTDGGNNFSIPLNLSNNTGTSASPQIDVS